MGSSAPPTHRRTSKACENCRIRRIKCEPPYPCLACRAAGLEDCFVREKARPNRQVLRSWRNKVSRGASHESSPSRADHEPVDFLRFIEQDLETVYETRTGKTINLQLPEEETSPLMPLDSPLPPLPAITAEQGLATLEVFRVNILPFFGFLTPSRVQDLFNRYVTMPQTMGSDQIALLYSCLALGKLRMLSVRWDGVSHGPLDEMPRDDVSWYRHAVEHLNRWGSASFTALQSLNLLQLYTMCTGSVTSTRRIIAKMVWQARELNIHRKATASAYPPEDNADILFFHVIFSDCYYATLCGLPPYFKFGEFDAELRARPLDDHNQNKELAFGNQPLLLRLVLLQSELLKQIHEGTTDTLSTDFVLRFEAKWTNWLDAFIGEQRSTGSRLADNFCNVHYHWDRIMLRSACVSNPLLTVSSLAIIARSATQILLAYRAIYRTRVYNLAWPQLRRVVTCAQLILQCYWRYELQKEEAETAMRIVFELLDTLRARWRSASTARDSLWELTMGLGLELQDLLPQPSSTSSSSVTTFLPPQSQYIAPPTTNTVGAAFLDNYDQQYQDDNGTSSFFDFLLDSSLWAAPRPMP